MPLMERESVLRELDVSRRPTYLQKVFFPKTPKSEFFDTKFFIGWDITTARKGMPPVERYISTEKSERILDIGTPGCGKSYKMHGYIDRLWQNHACFILTDIKGEYIANGGVQEKFADKLRPGEYPEETPFKSFIPHFLVKYNDNHPADTAEFQFSLKEFELKDLLTLFSLDENERADEQKCNLIRNIHTKIRADELRSLKEIREYVTNLSHGLARSYVLKSLKTITDYGVIGDSYKVDFIRELDKSVPSIYLVDYKNMGVKYTQVYLSIIIRKLMFAKEHGLIRKKLWIFIDEAHQFCPKDPDNPCSKQDILYCMKVGRAFGIAMDLLTQDLGDLDEKIFELCRYIFIPGGGLSKEKYKFVLKQAQIWDRNDSLYGWKDDVMRRMKKYQWMCVDRDLKKYFILRIPSPISYHTEER